MPHVDDQPWTARELDSRFRALDHDIAGLEQQIRVVAPVVPALSEAMINVKADVAALQEDVKGYINKSVTRQLILVSTPLFLGTLATLVALFAGKLT